MEEIKIQFNGTELTGHSIPITWAELLPEISKIVRLRPGEQVDGLIVTTEGLKAVVSLKRGPKKQINRQSEESLDKSVQKMLDDQSLEPKDPDNPNE